MRLLKRINILSKEKGFNNKVKDMSHASNAPLNWVELQLFCNLCHCRFIICCIIESEVTDLVLDAKRPNDLEDLGGNVLASMSFYQLRNAEHDFLELILVVSEDSRHAI